MMACVTLVLTCLGTPPESTYDCFRVHCRQGKDAGCTVFVDDGRALLDNEAPSLLVFGGQAICAHREIQRYAVFLNEKLHLL